MLSDVVADAVPAFLESLEYVDLTRVSHKQIKKLLKLLILNRMVSDSQMPDGSRSKSMAILKKQAGLEAAEFLEPVKIGSKKNVNRFIDGMQAQYEDILESLSQAYSSVYPAKYVIGLLASHLVLMGRTSEDAFEEAMDIYQKANIEK